MILRSVGLCLAFLCVSTVLAQVRVRVSEATTDLPVPYVHAHWKQLGTTDHFMAVTDEQGMLLLATHKAKAVELTLSCVGFVSVTDTLVGPGPFNIALHSSVVGLNEFVVTGQYSPTRVEDAVQRMKVIDATRIRSMAANDLGSALRNETNMRLAQDNILGSSVSFQGLSGENVKILIDGVPMIGRLNGNIDLSQIDLTGVERIEVLEGPSNVSYGTNALAGTLNLITRTNKRENVLGAKVYTEHIGRLNTTINGAFHRRDHALRVSAGRNFFSGWDPAQEGVPGFGPTVADTSRDQQWKPRETWFGRLNYSWVKNTWELGYTGSLMQDRITDRGEPRAPYRETAFDQVFTTNRNDHVVFANMRSKGMNIRAHAAHERYKRTRNTWFRDLTDMGSELVGTPSAQDTARFTLSNVRITAATTKDSARVDVEVGLDLNVETGAGDRIGNGEQRIGDHAIFASMEYRPVKRVTLRPAVRAAYNSRFNAPVIPSFNARVELTKRTVLRGAYSMGFRSPSLKEMYLYFVDVNHDIVGDPDLRPERAHHGDLGIAYTYLRSRSRFVMDAAGFFNSVRDMITLAQVEGTRYTYVNIGKVRTYGGSLNATWSDRKWDASIGGAITGREDDIVGAAQTFTPEVRASITRRVGNKGWSGAVFYKYTGEQSGYVPLSETEVARNTITAYHMADANIGRSFWKNRMNTTLGCNNLFDVRNVAATLAGGAHAGNGTSVPMGTGRTFFLRIELMISAGK